MFSMYKKKNSFSFFNFFFSSLYLFVFNFFLFPLNDYPLSSPFFQINFFLKEGVYTDLKSADFKPVQKFVAANKDKSENIIVTLIKDNLLFAYDVISTSIKYNVSPETVNNIERFEAEVKSLFQGKVDIKVAPSYQDDIKKFKEELDKESEKEDDSESDNDASTINESNLFSVGCIISTASPNVLDETDESSDDYDAKNFDFIPYKIIRRYKDKNGRIKLNIKPFYGSKTHKVYTIDLEEANVYRNPSDKIHTRWKNWHIPCDEKVMGRYSIKNAKHIGSAIASAAKSLLLSGQITIVNFIDIVYLMYKLNVEDPLYDLYKWMGLDKNLKLKEKLAENELLDQKIVNHEDRNEDEQDGDDEYSESEDTDEDSSSDQEKIRKQKRYKQMMINLKCCVKELIVNIPTALLVSLRQILWGIKATVEASIAGPRGLDWDKDTSTWKKFTVVHERSKYNLPSEVSFGIEEAEKYHSDISSSHVKAYLNLDLDPETATMNDIYESIDSFDYDAEAEGKEYISTPYKRFIYNVYGTAVEDEEQSRDPIYLFNCYFKHFDKYIGSTEFSTAKNIPDEDRHEAKKKITNITRLRITTTLKNMFESYLAEKRRTGSTKQWKSDLEDEMKVICMSPFYKVITGALIRGIDMGKAKLKNKFIHGLQNIRYFFTDDVIDSFVISLLNVLKSLKAEKITHSFYSQGTSDLESEQSDADKQRKYEERMVRGTFIETINLLVNKFRANLKTNYGEAIKTLKLELKHSDDYKKKKQELLEMLREFQSIIKNAKLQRENYFKKNGSIKLSDIPGVKTKVKYLDEWVPLGKKLEKKEETPTIYATEESEHEYDNMTHQEFEMYVERLHRKKLAAEKSKK